jgi:hypothetical protein
VNEVAVYAAGGCKEIICIPEGQDGWGWSRFVMELEKVRGFFKAPTGQGMARSTPFSEKSRIVGNGVNPGVCTNSHGKEGAPSYVEVLCKGLNCSEKGSQPPQLMVSLSKDHRVRPKQGKKRFRTVHSLGKDLSERWGLDEVMGVSRLPEMAAQSHPNTQGKPECSKVYAHASTQSNISAGFQLTSEKDTFSLLSLWRSQLEKLKADVNRALCRVSEGLLLFGPGSKPNDTRWKRKKDTKKKLGRLRWVPKIVKPNPSVSTSELAVFPETGSTLEKVSGDSKRSPATSETIGGVSSLVGFGKLEAEVILEVVKGPPESTGCIPTVPEIAGGSPFSLVVLAPVSMVSQSKQNSGADFSFPGSEAKIPVSGVLDDLPTDTKGAMVVWAGSGPSGSLVESDPAASISSLVFGPFIHNLFSGLGLRNRLELVSFPEAEPTLSCCPSDKVRGFSGKGSPELLLKMALEYRHPLGITCDGSKGQISTLYENLIANHDKKVMGSSSKSVNKGTRELNRLF